jgi:hypothetical protein
MMLRTVLVEFLAVVFVRTVVAFATAESIPGCDECTTAPTDHVSILQKTAKETTVEENEDVQIRLSPPSSVDLVYIYINGSDPDYQRSRQIAWADVSSVSSGMNWHMVRPSGDGQQANDSALSKDSGELLFSLRSMSKMLRSSIRKVFLVTETPPNWLSDKALDSGEFEIVHPRVIMPPGTYPNFNSRALESNLHKLPGLGDFYITLNDDLYLGHPVSIHDFLSEGTLKLYMSYDHPHDLDTTNTEAEGASWWNTHKASMRNANRLLDQHFGYQKDRKKISHAPLFWNKAFVRDAHSIFKQSLDNTSAHIFRSFYDVHPGFLYSHYMAQNKSIMAKVFPSHEKLLVFPKKAHLATFCDIVSKGAEVSPRFFSVNNHMTLEDQQSLGGWISSGLQTIFPEPSKYENSSLWHHADRPPNFCQLSAVSQDGGPDLRALL